MTVPFDFFHADEGNKRNLQWNQYLCLYGDNIVFLKGYALSSSFQVRKKAMQIKPNQTK